MSPFVKFRITNDWGGGFNGEITIVAGDDPLRNWSLSFLAPFTIESMWTSGSLLSVVDDLVTVGGVFWNTNVAAGGSATFAFTAVRGDTGLDMPTAFFLDGNPVAAPSLSVADVKVSEALTSLSFTVTLSSAAAWPVSVDWGTMDGTATAGADYLGAHGTLVFAAGQTSQTITINLLPDMVHEGRETLFLDLSNASGASLMDGHAVASIIDDDAAPNNGAVGAISTSGNQFVDANGQTVRIGAINWFGMETVRFAPDGLDDRNWMDMMDQMVELGFNAIRLPFSSQALAGNDLPTNIDYRLNPDLVGLNAAGIMDKIVGYAGEIGMRVLLDRHRGEAGDGPNDNGLWYDATYTEQVWIDDWVMLASRYAGNPTVLGADLSNEPFNGTWGDGGATDWKAAAERAGNAILAANPDWLIVVEGTAWHRGEGYWWGGNLMGAADAPVQLNVANRLVYSAHDYPFSLFPQSFFDDPAFPDNMPALFEQMWGYLFTSGTAPVLLGEFGSSMTHAKDVAWMGKLVAYLNGDFNADGVSDLTPGQQGISWAYWAWNSNEGANAGILDSDWKTPVAARLAALETLWAERFPGNAEDGGGNPGGEMLLRGDAHGLIQLALALGDVSLTMDAGGHVHGMQWTDDAGVHSARFVDARDVGFLDGNLTFDASSTAAAVESLYHALLGRQADVGGRSGWAERVDGGVGLAQVAAEIMASAESQVVNAGLSDTAFIGRLYDTVLFRAAESGGMAYWQSVLAHGDTRSSVAAGFAVSAEAQRDPGGVAAAGLVTVNPHAAWIGFSFAALGGRAVAGNELVALLPKAEAMSQTALLTEIMQSGAYQAGLGAMDNAGFVDALYGGALHRQGDAAGAFYHTQALAGGASRETVAMQFLASGEAQPYYLAYANHGVDLL